MFKLSIVVPCYNEAENLHALVEKCASVVRNNSDIEILLVNNGSTDNSQALLDELIAKENVPGLRTFLVPVNKGYGYGIMQGLKNTDTPVLCWTHADLQTDVNDCIRAFELYQKNRDTDLLVKGERHGRGVLDVIFTRLMSFYVYYKLHVRIGDINAQPKLFSRSFFDRIQANAPDDFSLDLYFLLKAQKYVRILTIPVTFHKRMAGEAKGGGGIALKIKLSKRTLKFIRNTSLNFK